MQPADHATAFRPDAAPHCPGPQGALSGAASGPTGLVSKQELAPEGAPRGDASDETEPKGSQGDSWEEEQGTPAKPERPWRPLPAKAPETPEEKASRLRLCAHKAAEFAAIRKRHGV